VAVIIRNDHGEVISGGAWPKLNLMDARVAEAESLRHGLQLIENLGCSPVNVESDCLELVDACNGAGIWGPYTSFLADCFQICQRVGMIKVQHCPREANKVAHNLAKSCFESDRVIQWDGDPPSHVSVDALNNVAFLSKM
jgi:ribonuclease HI